MRYFKVVMAVCLMAGVAVFMTANSSVASDSGMGKDTVILAKGNGPGNGTGNGRGTGPRNGTGPRGGTPSCPINPGYQS